MSDASRTLFHPFETGNVPVPGPDERVLFIGARPGFRLPEEFSPRPLLVQGFRPDFLALQTVGHQVVPEAEGEGYDLVLVQAGRHKGENDRWIADALARLKPGGTLVAAATKDDGADSLRKRWRDRLDDAGHLSKHHGVAFWGRRPEVLSDFGVEGEALVEGRFATQPGLFSHGEVDPASRLLADTLPSDLRGTIADFGAGWGYLSARIIVRFERVKALHLYEADHQACAAARRNLGEGWGEREIKVLWTDVTREKPVARYDAIVMNPPFHVRGRGADPSIGIAMIRAAAKAMKPGGRLFMVANRQLPYEVALKDAFYAVDEIGGDNRFKLYAAKR